MNQTILLRLIPLCILIGSVYGFRRNRIQDQVDRLEQRHQSDFVTLRDDIRYLWDLINDNSEIRYENISRSSTDEENKKFKEDILKEAKEYLAAIRKGLQSEKRFTREAHGMLDQTVEELREKNAEIDDKLLETQTKARLAFNCSLHATSTYVNLLNEMETVTDLLKIISSRLSDSSKTKNAGTTREISRPRSCMDVMKSFKPNGTYIIYNIKNQPLKVYCMIGMKGQMITLVSPETYYDFEINDLFNVLTSVMIFHKKTNGHQYSTLIEQLDNFRWRPISVQLNSNAGHSNIVNNQMGPYIYVGLTPYSMRTEKSTQGYKANGQSVTFHNCDGNPNGYFAFLFNHARKDPTHGYTKQIATQWKDRGDRITNTPDIPDEFFSDFELHFGGCGALATARDLRDVKGAAVGLLFDASFKMD